SVAAWSPAAAAESATRVELSGLFCHNTDNMTEVEPVTDPTPEAAPVDTDEAPGKNDDRKLFIGGLSWETKEPKLREYFGKYGEIESINIKTDPNTGRSRGFGFLVFKEAQAIDQVIAAGDHVLDGKKVDPKKAKARQGKIFVGGLKPEISDEDIKTYFAQFGTIVETEMPMDKSTNTRKGFCFISFEDEQVAKDLVKKPKQKIKDIEVDVKKATPKPDAMGRGGMMRGRGRGRGGPGWNQGYGGYGWGGYGGYGYDNGYGYGGYGYDYSGYGGYAGYAGYGGRQQNRHAPY
ncbi:unnamed protein product, partial [Meganyctiphanes norvegica]